MLKSAHSCFIEQDLLRRGIHPMLLRCFLRNPLRDERRELEILIPKLLKSYRNESLRVVLIKN